LPTELTGLSNLGEWLCDETNREELEGYLGEYFRETPDSRTGYAGRYFEWFIQRSQPNAFTSWDFLAVGSLSVSVPPQTQSWLLTSAEPARLLAECICVLEEAVAAGAPETFVSMSTAFEDALTALYSVIRNQHDVGYVTTSKLLAAKFPSLSPIRDDKVERILGCKNERAWRRPLREALQVTPAGADPMAVLAGLDTPAGSPRVTALRKLDVILWMKQKRIDDPEGRER